MIIIDSVFILLSQTPRTNALTFMLCQYDQPMFGVGTT